MGALLKIEGEAWYICQRWYAEHIFATGGRGTYWRTSTECNAQVRAGDPALAARCTSLAYDFGNLAEVIVVV